MSAFLDINERDNELYQAYKRALELPGINDQEAIRTAINTPTSCYWVSSDYVYREIMSRLKGEHATSSMRRKKVRSCKEQMYDDLFRIFNELRQKVYFRGCSVWFIVSFVVGKPAPRFYLSYRRARTIIARKRKENKQKRLNQNKVQK